MSKIEHIVFILDRTGPEEDVFVSMIFDLLTLLGRRRVESRVEAMNRPSWLIGSQANYRIAPKKLGSCS
ncbi:hypothetical protein EYF80_051478 [Liparis tanakae]|uniref:Uncharacterized protein n=1 Tax=Liparis tanakae TaxID=230148 RepID=A0A4Z2FBX0_9TELE|nr:hypothetical protein EYF80_051478 [Liparis tanakae]